MTVVTDYWENQFAPMAAKLGLNASEIRSIPLSFTNKSYIYALEVCRVDALF